MEEFLAPVSPFQTQDGIFAHLQSLENAFRWQFHLPKHWRDVIPDLMFDAFLAFSACE